MDWPTPVTQIRWLVRDDMPDILDIERQSFECPWGEDEFLETLRKRNCIGMAAMRGDDLAGFVIYELHKARLVLLYLAVHPDHRLQGVGRAMLARVKQKLSRKRRRSIVADLTEVDLDAQLFFSACGFACDDVLRDHWESGRDAYRFVYTLHLDDDDVSLRALEAKA